MLLCRDSGSFRVARTYPHGKHSSVSQIAAILLQYLGVMPNQPCRCSSSTIHGTTRSCRATTLSKFMSSSSYGGGGRSGHPCQSQKTPVCTSDGPRSALLILSHTSNVCVVISGLQHRCNGTIDSDPDFGNGILVVRVKIQCASFQCLSPTRKLKKGGILEQKLFRMP